MQLLRSKIVYKNLLILVFLIPFFIGCSSKQTLEVKEEPQTSVPEKTIEQPSRKKGSLFTRKGASLFSDKKDLQVGDIIKVIIKEVFKTKNKGTRDNDRTTNSSSGGGVFTSAKGASGGVGKTADKLNSIGLGIGFEAGSQSDFKATTENTATDMTETDISAMIEKVYANGNYFIIGTKELLINGEKQIVKVSGVIRPYDIRSDNTIDSKSIANLKIMYQKDGEGSEVLDKPWAAKGLESITPF